MISILVVIWTGLFLVASVAFSRYVKKTSKLPPGNIGWPLIGETLSLLRPHPPTCRGEFLDNQIAKYGKIFSSNCLGKQRIVSVDPELNRLIMNNNGNKFEVGDYPYHLDKLMSKDGLSFWVGDAHKHMRSIVLSFFMRNEGHRTAFLQDAEQHISELLTSWKDSVISAKEEINKFSFHFLAKQVIGTDYGNPETVKLHTEYQVFLRGFTSLPLYVPGTNYWKALKSRAYFLGYLKQRTEERIKKNINGEEISGRDDYLSCLLKDGNYSVEQIIGNILNIFASYQSTAKPMMSMIYFLKGCPKAIEHLREEHLEIIRTKKLKGDSVLTWDDYSSMNFAQCVINETLRLSTPTVFSFRKTTTDAYFKEYVFPQGCSFIIHMAGMHLDPTSFEDPQHFNPWRWLGPSGLKRMDGFIPFGAGVRLCPGHVFVRLQMLVFIHSLITKYDWELVGHDYPLSSPLIDFSKGLNIKVDPLFSEK